MGGDQAPSDEGAVRYSGLGERKSLRRFDRCIAVLRREFKSLPPSKPGGFATSLIRGRLERSAQRGAFIRGGLFACCMGVDQAPSDEGAVRIADWGREIPAAIG